MFQRFVFLGAAALALLWATASPGQVYAQHGRGRFHSGFRGGFDGRFGGFSRGFDRRSFDPRFGGFDRRSFDPRFGGLDRDFDRRVFLFGFGGF
jgi:hypothetical protein